MTKIKGQEYLDAAMKDVDQVNAEVFKGLGSNELLFEEYQQRAAGEGSRCATHRAESPALRRAAVWLVAMTCRGDRRSGARP